jgi:hypothetical protein
VPSLIGSPVVHAEAGTTAFHVTLPTGAAAGDYCYVVWTAGWTGVNWVEPALAISAEGVITGMNVQLTGPDGSNNWGIMGYCVVALTTADVALGYYGIQAANTTAYDGSEGSYIGDIFGAIGCVRDGIWDNGGVTVRALDNFGHDPSWPNAGVGIAVGYIWYDAAGTNPSTSDLGDFSYARGSDTLQVVAAGDFTFPDTGIPTYVIDENASYNTDTEIGFWISFSDAATIAIDTPASITITGGSPGLDPPLALTIDTPADLALAGGTPDLVIAHGLIIDTPANLDLAGGHPTVLATGNVPLPIDDAAGITIAGGAPTFVPTTNETLTIDTPANLDVAGGSPTLSIPTGPAYITIDSPANLTLAGGTPSLVAPHYLGPMLAVLDAEADLEHLYQGLPDAAVTGHDAPQIAVTFDAHVEISSPIFEIAQIGVSQLRLIETIVVTHPVPIVTLGRPTLPKYVGYYPSELVLIVGQDDVPPDHIHSIADPDPIWNPETSGWYIQPPASGVGDARWTVQTLPDPSPYSGQYYWLGDPSSEDGTSGIEAGARQWAPDLSTPGAPSWRSKFPYKPSVRAHVNYGAGGNILTITKGVRFNLQYIEHMWADWGADKNAPFSWVIVGIIMDFPSAGYEHTIMDVGGDPNAYGGSGANINNLGTDHGLTDLGVDTPSRAFIGVNANSQRQAGGLANGETIVSPFNYATRPKMWFGVWNGDASLSGSYSTAGQYLQAGAMPALHQRHMVIGRRGGILSRNAASHIVIFEMRCWFSALVEEQLDDQYAQLSSTWQFGSYG